MTMMADKKSIIYAIVACAVSTIAPQYDFVVIEKHDTEMKTRP